MDVRVATLPEYTKPGNLLPGPRREYAWNDVDGQVQVLWYAHQIPVFGDNRDEHSRWVRLVGGSAAFMTGRHLRLPEPGQMHWPRSCAFTIAQRPEVLQWLQASIITAKGVYGHDTDRTLELERRENGDWLLNDTPHWRYGDGLSLPPEVMRLLLGDLIDGPDEWLDAQTTSACARVINTAARSEGFGEQLLGARRLTEHP